MYYIYKITNSNNDKIYIGQTNNPIKRFNEHKNSFNKEHRKDYYSKKNCAFRKYGIDSFAFEIIEKVEDKLLIDSREEYWIEFYDSFNSGYNSTPKAVKPPLLFGEAHPRSVLTNVEVESIIYGLINTDNSLEEIADKYSVSKATISNISTGKNWNNPFLEYPLREDTLARKGSQNGNSKVSEEMVMKIREEYQTKTVSFLEEKYQYLSSKSSIRKILTGESYSHLPVYKKSQKRWTEDKPVSTIPLIGE